MYDEIVGVVDHTNYLILGITVALAWELPSKPPSEELDDLLTKLEDGTLDISRNDTVSNITYVDDPALAAPDQPTPYQLQAQLHKFVQFRERQWQQLLLQLIPRLPDADASFPPICGQLLQPSEGGRRKDNHYYYSRPGMSASNPFSKWSRPHHSPAQNSRYPYWALSSR